jgi:acyl-CoA thioesterase FadM
VTAARLVMRQAVVREAPPGGREAVCAEALATVIFLSVDYKPVRLPPGDRAVFAALQAQAAAAAGGGNGAPQ